MMVAPGKKAMPQVLKSGLKGRSTRNINDVDDIFAVNTMKPRGIGLIQ